MANQTKFNKLFLFRLFICISFSVSLISINAQSGRRISNPPPTPKPEATPEPTPTPKPKEDIKPEYSIIVVSNVRGSMNTNSTFRNPENAYSWVLERMRSSAHLAVQYGGESNLKKAAEMAKSSTESYVLLLELSDDNFARPTMGNTTVAQGTFWLDFSLFSPTTGKSKMRGRADLRPELLRGTVLNRSRRYCFPTLTNNDYLLLEASYEVAERTMNGLNILFPSVKCNGF
jgi:hypothetical protein